MVLAGRPPAFYWRTLIEAGSAEEQPGAKDDGEEAEGEDTEWVYGG